MVDRTHCPHFLFGGCPGDGCDRPCSATIYIPASKTTMGRHNVTASRDLMLIALIAVLSIVAVGAVAVKGAENIKEWKVQNEPV